MASSNAASSAKRILFIGDSLTYVNDLDVEFHRLTKEAGMDIPVVETCVKGGAPLKTLWQKTKAKQIIAQTGDEGWDYVVVQEDLPETTMEYFQKFSKNFLDGIEAGGGKPLLLACWPYSRPFDSI